MIPKELLLSYNAQYKTYKKGEIIFSENQTAHNYFQISNGAIKMNNYNEDGKEFIQGIFYKEQSFGEPPLFIDVKYPANAEAISDSEIIVISKEQLFNLLQENPEIHLKITQSLAKRLYYKAIIASEISSQEPAHRVLRFFDYLKNDVYKIKGDFTFKIEYTRQQIADILGLRVETVIRVIKLLEKKGDLKILKRKVYR
ncbi:MULTISPECIES: Crp/Fnr family transcriptional regulator [unclassified Tenacibaculum]|uniref:Crp/Fnr family transcriptional regulator n=1 Tax=unclassified Tenacibaculum TaxID=2635139 RepID=UPI001F27E7C9|nr:MULTISPECIES: Crp/Fnr family transcriptional regulator [unclassified Tenacibaculum]MCF2875609.1 Crp/Fnr family transcriptional regulator [Tenacibaculum sp. Cn5-1]MCF2935685.1 Crp/Fnr family transcriptional regulator [Tenacibaculum sp. Cn5-34]MCG7512245.1 Crp/Fnr family transcriptional regulator [Tenacibaculum sp. Cn5-46]